MSMSAEARVIHLAYSHRCNRFINTISSQRSTRLTFSASWKELQYQSRPLVRVFGQSYRQMEVSAKVSWLHNRAASILEPARADTKNQVHFQVFISQFSVVIMVEQNF